MEVTIHRRPSTRNGTFGILSIFGKPTCVTCEEPWNNNIPNGSCIPVGTYHCIAHNGVRFTNVWELQNVSGRDAILIHSGNTINDTHGCILVGNAFGTLNGLPAITESLSTLNMLRGILPNEFDLIIAGE
jgi:uncharacterized protein DUF5675